MNVDQEAQPSRTKVALRMQQTFDVTGDEWFKLAADALLDSNDTNRRLNRRLGDTEHSLHSLVSSAQKETKEALRLVGDAQARAERLMKDLSRHNEINRELHYRLHKMANWVAGVTLWAVATTIYAMGWP